MKIKILLIITIYCFQFASCKKTPVKDLVESNPTSLMQATIHNKNIERDFTILVSSTLGISVLDSNALARTSVAISAFEKNNRNIGELTINNLPIPFYESHYALQTDTSILSASFVGRLNDYTLLANNQNEFPNFSRNLFAPNATLLSYSGLVDGAMPRNKDLVIAWQNDNTVVNKSIVIIYGWDDATNGKMIYKIPQSNVSSVIFTSNELEALKSYKRIKVCFARGYNQLEVEGGMKIMFEFLHQSWSTINFQN